MTGGARAWPAWRAPTLPALVLLAAPVWAQAAEPLFGVAGFEVGLAGGKAAELAAPLRILLGLTVLSLAPAILMSMTSFVRIVIVLSMLRTALGMQQTPPNTVIVSLAMFLTLFTMAPTFEQINRQALQPYGQGRIEALVALERGVVPLRDFMVRQTREQDMALMVELAHAPQPETADDISMVQLIPAFMLSELRAAFQIGFVIFLPFLLVDLVVSGALMSLGMMMVPPASIALPLKVLLFVLIDGWNLVVRALLSTFH